VRTWTSIVVAFAAAWGLSLAAHAAGLGRLTVLSPLGQPLVAEVEIVSVQRGEEEGLAARLAAPDAFATAGIELNPALLGLRISVEHHDKRPYLRLTTTQPINEPFLDLLIELQWSTGRLVREYTFLLDPPEYKGRQAVAAAPTPPVPPRAPEAAQPPPPEAAPPAPEAKPAPAIEETPLTPGPAPAEPSGTAQQAPEATPSPAPTPSAEAAPEQAPSTPTAAEPAKPGPNTYEVKRGDTLAVIAKQYVRPGVTLDQMLMAIFRANEDAFIRGNVNLVRTGKILNIPDADAVGTVDRDEAARLVREHRDQFREYRARLAAAPAAADAAGVQRDVSGRIEPKPEAAPPAQPGDQVRLSKGEPAKPGAPGARAAQQDDAAARDRALQEAQSRIAQLEKNVADQQKLLEMRNQQLAEAEKNAPKPGATSPVPAVPAQPPVAQAPEKPAAKAPEKPALEAPKPQAEAPKPAATPEAPKPVPAAPEAAKPGAPNPEAAKAKPKAAPPPPVAQKEWYEEYLDDPMMLGGVALVVLLLVVYAIYAWRRKKAAHAKFQDRVLGAAAAGGGAAASLAQTTATSTVPASVSQVPSTAPAGMEAEDVDPIAEADVYMAYGRDAQAEEILKEALQKDAGRAAVHAKLLEIYAQRKDAKAFEQTALKLKNLTKGAGPEWEKAASLGRSLDPQNSAYGEPSAAPAAAPAAAAAAVPMLDFDLGGASQTAALTPDISLDEPAKDGTASGLDLNLGTTQKLPASPDQTIVSGAAQERSGGLDFNLDLGDDKKAAAVPGAAGKPAAEPSGGLDFNLDLGAEEKKPDAAATQPAVDLSSISLDLGPTDTTVMASKPSSDPKWQEVATKLDLAKAYEEMGDKDGARELLREVVKDGDAAQRGSAEQLLAKLG